MQPRQRNLWVTDTFEWRREARLAQSANPMSDSEASAFVFVASCLSNQFALPGKRHGVTRGLGSFSMLEQLDPAG
jgi:hypothetical protein